MAKTLAENDSRPLSANTLGAGRATRAQKRTVCAMICLTSDRVGVTTFTKLRAGG
jgi:hypothetical protein